MEKKTKTPEGNQKKNPQNQTKVRKSGISFELDMEAIRKLCLGRVQRK